MIIKSRAPARIDLAGGTLDLWPLHLFVRQPVTINMGINLWATATLEFKDAPVPEVLLRSEDQKNELKFAWSDIEKVSAPPELQLHLKLLKHFGGIRHGISGLRRQLILTTSAESPAGAGLGGSSTLGVAIAGALSVWGEDEFALEGFDSTTNGDKLIETVRDVETTVIQVPAGVQDYYGAMYGGLQSLRWGVSAHRHERLPEGILTGLESRVLLFYSGQSRNSGINNWALYKDFIDNREGVRAKFDQIAAAANQLETALRESNWAAVGEAIAHEWEARSGLASQISTPEINRAFAAAKKEGATAGKICGAGGGGCFFIYLPSDDPQRAAAIRTKIEAIEGIRSLPFKAVPQGLEVQVKRA